MSSINSSYSKFSSTTRLNNPKTLEFDVRNRMKDTKKKEKHPKNALIVNFSEGETVTREQVFNEFSKFGLIRTVILCTMDACQAFVVFQSKHTVTRLLKITQGLLLVDNLFVWSLCRPKAWKKLMEDVTPTPTDSNAVTVDELTEIYTDFVRRNGSSVSQASLMTTSSTQSWSTQSVAGRWSMSSGSSIAGSCDSTSTLTPFSIFPAQQSSGFIPLPPPYHYIPDTAFFRRTKIVPPPPKPSEKSYLQRITDQYIASFHQSLYMESDTREVESRRRQSPHLELKCSWWSS